MSESNEITFDLNELKEVEELDKKLELLQGMLEQIEETAEDYDTTVLLDVGGEQIERDIRDIKRRLKSLIISNITLIRGIELEIPWINTASTHRDLAVSGGVGGNEYFFHTKLVDFWFLSSFLSFRYFASFI